MFKVTYEDTVYTVAAAVRYADHLHLSLDAKDPAKKLDFIGADPEEFTFEDGHGWEDPPAEPTQLDRVEAQATYTALMTDTLLEETEA